MKLNKSSLDNLAGVHPDLVKVAHKCVEITAVDFIITEGVRTVERQKALVRAGAAQTMNSRHIPGGPKNLGHAFDVAAVVAGDVRWDWPLYERIAVAMKMAAQMVDVPIEWGGDWRSFKDGPHYQLPWSRYPL